VSSNRCINSGPGSKQVASGSKVNSDIVSMVDWIEELTEGLVLDIVRLSLDSFAVKLRAIRSCEHGVLGLRRLSI
jgi:hypothetical protein